MEKPFVKKTINFINSHKKAVRLTALLVCAILSLSITASAVGVTFGVNVELDGKTIATVKDSGVFEDGKEIAIDTVHGEGAEETISKPKYSLTLTVTDNLANKESVADAIIENTADIVKCTAVVVNGEALTCTTAEGLEVLLNDRLTAYDIEGAENSAVFVDDVKLETGYYLKSQIDDIATASDVIDSLSVKTTSNIVTNISIPYSTRTIKTDTQVTGYYNVTTAGKNGVKTKTQSVVSIDGEWISMSDPVYEVVSNPVNAVVTIGTAPAKLNVSGSSETSSGLICPIKRGNFKISAYWGDGRNHKAIDLAANKGTAIYAAAAGTVVSAGWDGNYGYSVLIDHGNGLKTRYSHASALYVKTGAVVGQGDVVAAVGSTGYSTGNHLHFEVIINGTRVNPAPYIGL